MILRGADTPYNKRNAPDVSAGTLVTSDTLVNKDIAHLITEAAILQTKEQMIRNVCMSQVDPESALETIRAILRSY